MSQAAPAKGKMKRRVAVGGACAGLVALGLWLATLFGLGFGTGTGGSAGKGKTTAEKTTQKTEAKETKGGSAGDVIEVRTLRDGYEVRKVNDAGAERWDKTDLNDIAALVDKAPGNAQGIRLRITTGPESVAPIETSLEAKLQAMGLERDKHYLIH